MDKSAGVEELEQESWTDRTGHPEQGSRNRTAGYTNSWYTVGQLGQDNQPKTMDRRARTGQPGQDSRRKQTGQYSQDSKQRQNSQNMTARTGQLGWQSGWTSGQGQPWQLR